MSDKTNRWEDLGTDAGQVNSNGPSVSPQPNPVSSIVMDPNAINTGAIHGPVVIFYGPRTVGKTVALIRLSKFIARDGGITIKPNRSFRTDEGYPITMHAFNDLLTREAQYSPRRTGNIDFLLLDYFENGQLLCQLLEAPGEHFFDPKDNSEPKNNYVAYFQNIRHRNYKKVYVFFFEENMFGSPDMRERYSRKIANLIRDMNPDRDRILILYNKVDEIPELLVDGRVNVKTLKDYIFRNPEYNEFKIAIQKSKLKHIYFTPFSSGTFAPIQGSEDIRWVLGLDDYPGGFWSNIRASIKKGWSLW